MVHWILFNIGASISTFYLLVVSTIWEVTNFVLSYNPQITKTRINLLYLYKSNIKLNNGLSMLVGISEAIRVLFFCLILVFFVYLHLVLCICKHKNSILTLATIVTTTVETTAKDGNSAKTKALIFKSENPALGFNSLENQKFNQWLAGLIDGDGCFQLSKKGYANLEIVAHIRDKNILYQIKQKFGGSVKIRAGLNHLRYRMHHKQGMLNLIKAVNGEIRNPIRLLQLNKICEKYNIPVIQPCSLIFENA